MQTIIRTSREYAAMAEAELAAESELAITHSELANQLPREHTKIDRITTDRQNLVDRAAVYARLAQMAATHEAS